MWPDALSQLHGGVQPCSETHTLRRVTIDDYRRYVCVRAPLGGRAQDVTVHISRVDGWLTVGHSTENTPLCSNSNSRISQNWLIDPLVKQHKTTPTWLINVDLLVFVNFNVVCVVYWWIKWWLWWGNVLKHEGSDPTLPPSASEHPLHLQCHKDFFFSMSLIIRCHSFVRCKVPLSLSLWDLFYLITYIFPIYQSPFEWMLGTVCF